MDSPRVTATYRGGSGVASSVPEFRAGLRRPLHRLRFGSDAVPAGTRPTKVTLTNHKPCSVKHLTIKFEDEQQFERIKAEKERRGLTWRGVLVEWSETSSADE